VLEAGDFAQLGVFLETCCARTRRMRRRMRMMIMMMMM
jgi:hypothetical protein